MKLRIVLLFCLALGSLITNAQVKKKKPVKKAVTTVPVTTKVSDGINWISLEEAEKLMAKTPKKLYVDFYTDWCGWCKVMDKKTFTHPKVIQYINKNFYAVKFNTEKVDNLNFQGKIWNINKQYKTNDWAIQMMNGNLSYPTSLIMEEGFTAPIMYPGYVDIKNMEAFLKFLVEEKYKSIKWDEYIKGFKATWE